MDEELLELDVFVTYGYDVDLPLQLRVGELELDAALWLDVPDPAGSDVGGLLLGVPYPL